MASELTGLSSADRVTLPSSSASSGTGAMSPAKGLTRIAPVDPREPAAIPTHPLGRSGLDLLDLLATTDLVASRGVTGPVAMEVGLEQARGSLLRNLPGDALAALDGVWEGARRTEEGWYLRSGALTVLGLPGESERVAAAGLGLRPTSLALRFMQSLSRMALGDLAGARAVLQLALERSPGDPLLQVQLALVQAKQGDSRAADALLTRAAADDTDHPALVWGRAAFRAIVADATRQRSQPTPSDWPVAIPDPAAAPGRATPLVSDAIFPDITGAMDAARADDVMRKVDARLAAADALSGERRPADVAAAALERFGARVAMRPLAEVAREARMLMRAFSAGGTLASATNAEQAHAARTVLTTFLGVATGEGAETPAPVRAMISQLVPLLQQGRFDEAERLVRRQSALAREPISRLLLAIVRGADLAETPGRDLTGAAPPDVGGAHDARVTPFLAANTDRMSGTPAAGMPMVRGEAERGPLVPVRLGLGLLEETPTSRASLDPSHGMRTATALPYAAHQDGVEMSFMIGDSPQAVRNAEGDGEGWGAAREVPPPRAGGEWADGAGVRAVALVCVALAAGAVVTGHGVVAISLGVGAAWLGLRRSGREGDGSREHDRTTPQ